MVNGKHPTQLESLYFVKIHMSHDGTRCATTNRMQQGKFYSKS